MNSAWTQVRAATKVAGPGINRKALRDRLRTEPELAVARKGVFGAWRRRGNPSDRTDQGQTSPPPEGE